MVDLAALQQTLGISFDDPSLLEQALVHSSYVNEKPGIASASNERLEFLGDAVLGFVVAERLYQDFPHSAEGEMTRLRAALVRRDTLARMARTIKLGDYLYLGKGVLAKSNAEQVVKIIRIARELGIEPATPSEARQILGLKGLDRVAF